MQYPQYTPKDACRLASELLPQIMPTAQRVISGRLLNRFKGAAYMIQKASEVNPPTAFICREIEEYFGIMINLFLDAVESPPKPFNKDQRKAIQAVLDGFEIAGMACHKAGLSNLHSIG